MSEFISESLSTSDRGANHALATVTVEPVAELHAESSAEPAEPEQFLRLHLTADFPALLPIQQVKEVLTVPREQIVPIPDMPAWVMGIYNWRGEILWMVDLGHLCGLTPWYQQPAYVATHSTVVLRVKEPSATTQMLGLVVSSVEDMETCNLSAIQALPLSSLPPQLATFLCGYWWKSDDDILAVLEGAAIMAALPKS